MIRRAAVGGALAGLVMAAAVFVLGATPAPGPLAQGGPPPLQPPPPGPGATPPPPRPAMTIAPTDSFAAQRDSLMNEVLKKIAGREKAPAESVFKDIRVLKGLPAERLPRIMNLGFGRSLGVNCTHCHVLGHWADEDKPQKQIARDMMAFSRTINDSLLPRIKNLKSEKPQINCTTCHRGQVKPATNL